MQVPTPRSGHEHESVRLSHQGARPPGAAAVLSQTLLVSRGQEEAEEVCRRLAGRMKRPVRMEKSADWQADQAPRALSPPAGTASTASNAW